MPSGIFSTEAEWALMGGVAEDYHRLFLSDGPGGDQNLPAVPQFPRNYPQNTLQNPQNLQQQHIQQQSHHPQQQSWGSAPYPVSHAGSNPATYARGPHQSISRAYSSPGVTSGPQILQPHLSTSATIPETSIPSLATASSVHDDYSNRPRATSASGLSYTSSLTSRSNSPLVAVSGIPTTHASGLGITAMSDIGSSAHYPSLSSQSLGNHLQRPTQSPRIGDSLTAYGQWNPATNVWTCAYPGCTSRVTFTRGCDLRKHYKRHTKWLFCRWEGCPSATEGGFSSKKDRARHEAKHNPGIRCTEPGCGRVFSRVDNMKDHVKRIHRRGSAAGGSTPLAQGAAAAATQGLQGFQGEGVGQTIRVAQHGREGGR